MKEFPLKREVGPLHDFPFTPVSQASLYLALLRKHIKGTHLHRAAILNLKKSFPLLPVGSDLETLSCRLISSSGGSHFV